MKTLLFLVLTITLFSACSLDQTAVNNLEGKWTTTARTKNGQNDLTPGDTWVFDQCTNAAQNDCTGTYEIPTFLGTITVSFVYSIYNNGTQFSIDFGPNSIFKDVSDANIVEQTTTTIKINFTDNGDYYEQTLTKK